LSCRFRHLDCEKLAAAKKEFLQMERDGIIPPLRQPLVLSPALGAET
jgi:hypothetical protein